MHLYLSEDETNFLLDVLRDSNYKLENTPDCKLCESLRFRILANKQRTEHGEFGVEVSV